MTLRRRLPRAQLRVALDMASVPIWVAAPDAAAESAALRFRSAPGRLAPGARVYAVGDVRGARAELAALLVAIAADLRARPVARPYLVFLGGLIGPGPDSAGVLDLVAGSEPAAPRRIVLKGDSEHMLLQALAGDRPAATDWMHAGGGACLASWGVPPDTPRAAWAASIPGRHLMLLRRLRLSWRAGTYLFVHAGLRPGRTLGQQSAEDLIAIRQPFLASEEDFGFVVVHGHNATPRPELRANRIGVDTGSGLGGPLTCAVLEEERVAFLSPPLAGMPAGP